MQDTSRIFMVRPASFGYNEQTALSNTFQNRPAIDTDIASEALKEFDTAVKLLRQAGVQVWVIEDTPEPVKPDAIFPNNWISTHEDGTIVLYPMQTPNRSRERRPDIVQQLQQEYAVSRVIDLSGHEAAHRFLEGTGSIVFDHNARIAYACLSVRTDADLLSELCTQLGYTTLCFRATNKDGIDIYHTNVVMGIGTTYVMICLESIADAAERQQVSSAITRSGKELITISLEQMAAFAGNVLSVNSVLVLSATAAGVLTEQQRTRITAHTRLLIVNIPVIERIGGGGIRCMMAQNFLPPQIH